MLLFIRHWNHTLVKVARALKALHSFKQKRSKNSRCFFSVKTKICTFDRKKRCSASLPKSATEREKRLSQHPKINTFTWFQNQYRNGTKKWRFLKVFGAFSRESWRFLESSNLAVCCRICVDINASLTFNFNNSTKMWVF